MTTEPACALRLSRLADTGAGMGHLPSGGSRPHVGMLASGTSRKEYTPTPCPSSFIEDRVPLPQPCSCFSGQREGKWPEGEV